MSNTDLRALLAEASRLLLLCVCHSSHSLVGEVADLRARITAALAEKDDGGWLPIESAPKDGTYILVYCGDDFQAVCYWSDSIWATKGGAWIYDECRSDTVELQPTHWQPLPPLPERKV